MTKRNIKVVKLQLLSIREYNVFSIFQYIGIYSKKTSNVISQKIAEMKIYLKK